MGIHAVIYTKPNCPQCMMTKRVMVATGLDYVDNYYGNAKESNLLDISSDNPQKRSWSENKINKIKERYHINSLPLVKVVQDDTGEMLEYWSGFDDKKIKKWASYSE